MPSQIICHTDLKTVYAHSIYPQLLRHIVHKASDDRCTHQRVGIYPAPLTLFAPTGATDVFTISPATASAPASLFPLKRLRQINTNSELILICLKIHMCRRQINGNSAASDCPITFCARASSKRLQYVIADRNNLIPLFSQSSIFKYFASYSA